MPDNVTLSAGTLYGFLLVLARVGGSLIFVPLPGVKSAPEPARIALALGFTLALYSQWPVVRTDAITVAALAGWALAEAAVGLAIGVSVAIALGLDPEILRLFALSLEKVPAGAYVFSRATAEPAIRLGATLFSVGVRLALPVVALLVMVDIALALLGRINAQLQLLTLAFPAKMLTTLILLSWMASMFPRILREITGHAWTAAYRMLGI